jgi:hypothetical protein
MMMMIIIIIIFGMKARYGPYSSLDFLIIGFLRGGAFNPTPNPCIEDQAFVFVTLGYR